MSARPRCGEPMRAARVCARPAGHPGPHESGESLRRQREAAREYNARHYAENADAKREYGRRRYSSLRAENPFRQKARNLLGSARSRAKNDGLPFDLTAEWVERELAQAIEHGCPLLGIGIRLDASQVTPGSPTIDKFDPGKGYTQENCWVISHRANTMKQNASLDFMRRILEYADTRFTVDPAVETA